MLSGFTESDSHEKMRTVDRYVPFALDDPRAGDPVWAVVDLITDHPVTATDLTRAAAIERAAKLNA